MPQESHRALVQRLFIEHVDELQGFVASLERIEGHTGGSHKGQAKYRLPYTRELIAFSEAY
jgi:hypothetical protein